MNTVDTNLHTAVAARLLGEQERPRALPRHFGRYMMRFEAAVYGFAKNLCAQYRGGYWNFYEFGDGGFYMAPTGSSVHVNVNTNGFDGDLSADAFGITVCLFACSHLSFHIEDDTLARHFHLLRDFALSHAEASLIFAAID